MFPDDVYIVDPFKNNLYKISDSVESKVGNTENGPRSVLVMQDQNCGYFEAINYLKSQYKNINLDKITQLQIEKEEKKFGFDKITKILEEDKKNKVVDSKAVEYLKSRGFLNPEVIAEMATLKVINDRLYIPHFHLAKRGENYDKEFICTDYISMVQYGKGINAGYTYNYFLYRT